MTRARWWIAVGVLWVAGCRAACPWLDPPKKPIDPTLTRKGPPIKLYYCMRMDQSCHARAWFLEEYDCQDLENLWWSKCEQKDKVMVCSERQFDSVYLGRIKTRCSVKELTWADVADGGHRTQWPLPR